MDTHVLNSNTMFTRDEPAHAPRQPAGWFRALSALQREAAEICARIDRELPVAEARADRLMRHYGI
ncbi:MAG: hypothetical protein EXR07_05150 [Acetobacteraceae bacterium]|nr:hypothetical protein [Acetobacteraceae bacterium]